MITVLKTTASPPSQPVVMGLLKKYSPADGALLRAVFVVPLSENRKSKDLELNESFRK